MDIDLEKIESIVYLSAHPVAIWDRAGHYVRGNEAYLSMFRGHPPPEYSLWDDPVILATEHAQAYLDLRYGSSMHFPPIRYNSRDAHPDAPDNPIVFETVVYPVCCSSADPEYFLFLYIDRTQEYELRDELQDAKRSIARLLRQFRQDHLEKESATRTPAEPSLHHGAFVAEYHITAIELRVCDFILEGLTDKEIADRLCLSPATIHSHRNAIRLKLGLVGSKERLFTALNRIDIRLRQ